MKWIVHLISSLLSFLLLITACFFLMHSVPGNPFQGNDPIPEATIKQLNELWGLDKPLYEQYYTYLLRIFRADFGVSMRYPSESVATIIKKSFFVSLSLGICSLLIALPVGIFCGILWGKSFVQQKKRDVAFTILSTVGISVPNFVIASSLQLFFCIWLPLLPVARWGSLEQAILPILSLSIWPMTTIMRISKMKTIELLHQEWISMLKMRGITDSKIFFSHLLPHVLLTIFSYLAPIITNLFIGSFAVERVYGIPGLGQWLINSILCRDYPLISGLTFFYISILFVCSTVIAIVMGKIDKRRSIS